MTNFFSTFFNALKGNNSQPKIESLYFNEDGSMNENEALKHENFSTPMTIADRLFGRTLTKDIDSTTLPDDEGKAEIGLQRISDHRNGFFEDLSQGYNENRYTPISLNNFGEDKNFATRIGEGLGSVAKFAESPLGRGLLVGGLVAANGGNGLEAITYGTETGAINQAKRSADELYRDALEDEGIDTSDTVGYISDNTYSNLAKNNINYQNMLTQQQRAMALNNLRMLQAEKLRIENSALPEIEKAKKIKALAEAEHTEELMLSKINEANAKANDPLGWAKFNLSMQKYIDKKI